jgi:2-methylcitrate dehydratase PrpD
MEKLGITRRLAEFVVSARYEDLPIEVVRTAKLKIMDTLGCGIAGYVLSRNELAPVLKVLDEIGGREECTALVSGKKTSWFNAILGNGTLMHSIDYDDTRAGLATHIGAVVAPSVLGLSEKLGSSGKDAILATVLGYEVVFRISNSVMPTHYDFWHSTGTNGTFGGAVAAGKLLGLNADEMEMALGLAADQASGLISCIEFGDLTKSLHGGLTSAKGALAAMLSKHGATGPRGILEYSRGYCNAYSKEPHVEKIIHDLGKSFDIVNNYPKLYPSGLATHCAIEATLKLVRTTPILVEEVLRVNVKTLTSIVTTFSNPHPGTPLAARLSTPYCIAAAILDRELGIRQFEQERLQDQRIKELIKKIHMEADPALDSLYPEMIPAKIEILTKTGQVFSAEEYYPKGFPKNPISDEELEVKFESLCRYVFEKERISELKEMIKQMESMCNISELMRLLVENRPI